jgi:F-type H+-transporting ATPase subunit gamma
MAFWTVEYDEVYIIYSEFVSMAKQIPMVQTTAAHSAHRNDEMNRRRAAVEYQAEHICEPSPEELLGDLLPTQRLCSALPGAFGNIHQ